MSRATVIGATLFEIVQSRFTTQKKMLWGAENIRNLSEEEERKLPCFLWRVYSRLML
jgi:hypothetical protein